MSAVYMLRADAKNFRWLGVSRNSMPPLGTLLRGESLLSRWKPPEIEQLIDDELPCGPIADYAYLNGVPTFSARAVEGLSEMLKANGELLPLACDFGEYFAYNITRVINALDESRSVLRRFSHSGRVMRIELYAFNLEELADATIFRLPQMASPTPYVTNVFRESVRALGLTGFRFLELYGDRGSTPLDTALF